MRLTYKEYIKKEYNRACENDWFDPEGNSTTATSNRSFLKELKLQVKGVNSSLLDLVDKEVLKELLGHLLGLVVFISTPLLYIPLLLLRTVYKRKRAKEEMISSWKKYNKKEEKV